MGNLHDSAILYDLNSKTVIVADATDMVGGSLVFVRMCVCVAEIYLCAFLCMQSQVNQLVKTNNDILS